jgi:hypothetical protein
MVRDNPEPAISTDSKEEQSSSNASEDMSECRDSDLADARYYARQLARSDFLTDKEAQAFAYREIAGLDPEVTARDTDLAVSDVDLHLDSAEIAITTTAKYLEVIEETGYFGESENE